jgi:hypothetical protein
MEFGLLPLAVHRTEFVFTMERIVRHFEPMGFLLYARCDSNRQFFLFLSR